MLYLLAITGGLCLSYIFLPFVFAVFFPSSIQVTVRRAQYGMSMFWICLLSFGCYVLAHLVSDPELSNRLLHILGGGFLALFVCFLVVRDNQLKISRIQFLLLSGLVVIALGVGNEMVEFVLQNYFNWVFAQTVVDTWLDLISNMLGAIIGAVIFTPFLKEH